MKQTSIYLDYAATAPLRDSSAKAMAPYWADDFGNPSSVHAVGRTALNAVDAARRRVAEILDCEAGEIIFTSGGTESDNLAVIGLAAGMPKGHIITSTIEHKAVLESCQSLEKWGWQVTYLNPNKNGLISAESVIDALRDDTRLVSIMYANNEIGTIQPIREIGKKLQALNKERKTPVLFHTDGVQAATLLPLGTKYLHVDMLSLSGHKLGGPKGTGILFVKKGINLTPLFHGGGQESGRRSGTLNVPGIIGMSTALAEATKLQAKESARLAKLQKLILTEVAKWPSVVVNGDVKSRLVSNVNISIKGHASDELVIALDRQGICVSAASACASGSIQPSYVIEAMGVPVWRDEVTVGPFAGS